MNIPPTKIDQIYFENEPQYIEITCHDCDERMPSAIDEIKSDNRLKCKCGAIRVVDTEDLFNRREMILNAVRRFKDS